MGDRGRQQGPAQHSPQQTDPRIRAETNAGSVPIPPFQSAILRLHRVVGNRALAGLLGSSAAVAPVVQRDRTKLPAKTEERRRASARERALRALRAAQSPQDARERVVKMMFLFGSDEAALEGLEEARLEIRSEVNKLRDDPKVVYCMPPLDESEGRRRLQLIEREERGAFDGLLSQRAPFQQSATEAMQHEWGLGIARTGRGEAVLIIGEKAHVTWTGYLKCLMAVAHSHPYFKEPGFPGGRDPSRPRGEGGSYPVTVKTKEIATNHLIGGRAVDGAVLWSDLVTKKQGNEMLKIFPSGEDIGFAADKHLSLHTVYTTYRVLNHPAGKVIINPDFKTDEKGKAKQEPESKTEETKHEKSERKTEDPFAADKVAATPLLRFEIRGAAPVNKEYECEMAAFAGNVQFWTGRISTTAGTFLQFL
jgi:hypothetical protein